MTNILGGVESARIRLEAVKLAREGYMNLPYHNFGHAYAVASTAVEIATRCIEENVPVHLLVVFLGGLFHDYDYYRDHRALGYKSKEELSTAMAAGRLPKIGVPYTVIKAVMETIIASSRNAPFTTVEQKIVRAADLRNFAGLYEGFLRGTFLFKHEEEMLGGRLIPWPEWKQRTHTVAEFYCSQDIRLTSAYTNPDGTSQFHSDTRKNVARLLAENNDTLESLFLAQIKN